VSVLSLGWEVPPAVLSSAAIEERLGPVYERLGLLPGRLELMTGIRERRYWPEQPAPSEVAIRAGRMALERAGLDPKDVGCLIHASVCRDFLEPATASVVHHALGLGRECMFFDLSNACLGVVNAMLLVDRLIAGGSIEHGLIVAGENGLPLVESTIRALLADPSLTRRSIKGAFSSLTIGSGAAAVLLSREGEGPRLIGGVMRAGTEHNGLCRGGALGHADAGVGADSVLEMRTDAEALLAAGLELAAATWREFVAATGFADPDRTITHQVGKAHTRALYERLGLPIERGHLSYEWLGNVGSVSLPLTLALAADAGFVARGHRVALLGIGSGLSSAMLGVEW